MKLYTCNHCQSTVYFENDTCLQCGYSLGFDMRTMDMITLEKVKDDLFARVDQKNETFRFCNNAAYGVCNWVIPAEYGPGFCLACSLNRIIPSLDKEINRKRWKNIETAKHRLVYSLLRLELPVKKKDGEEEDGIAFDFMADTSPDERVMTGHDKGVITLNIEEADETERTKNKQNLGERYRTLLGHFRHEIGHYYWDRLIRDSDRLADYRALFGNEEVDYAKALETYYQNGAPTNCMQNFISPYASAHPWEDWAETWAHYLHLMDTLETAFSFGIEIHPEKVRDAKSLGAEIKRDPYETADFNQIFSWWLPLTFAVNSLNRSMGHPDFYPFVISEGVSRKLKFIHELVLGGVSEKAGKYS